MLIYFGGCERPNAIHTLAKAGGQRVMISFAEPPTKTCWRLYREYGIEIMADSGAFSAWKRGIEVNLADYMAWLTKPVYHFGEPVEILAKLVGKYPLIGLGLPV